MANQRKPGKKKIGFWLTEGEIQTLDELAGEAGLNRIDTFRNILTKYALEQNKKDKKERTKNK